MRGMDVLTLLGPRAVAKYMCRYHMYRNARATSSPAVLTVFSAPNCLDVSNNKGAIFKYEPGRMNIRQFSCVRRPYQLSNFTDAFAWSLPFVCDKSEYLLFIFVAASPTDFVSPLNQSLIWSLR